MNETILPDIFNEAASNDDIVVYDANKMAHRVFDMEDCRITAV
jgi:hypothetical protein